MAGEDERADRRPADPPDSARTEMLPRVPADTEVDSDAATPNPPVADAPKVRAVARRPATALPALGRSGGPRLPMSARVTVERRRRAAGGSPPEAPADQPPAGSAELPDPDPEAQPLPEALL